MKRALRSVWIAPAVALSCASHPPPTPPPPVASPPPPAVAAPPAPTIRIDTSEPLGTFRPARALGAAIDRLPTRALDALYAPSTIQAVLQAGWGAVTYRSNTELHVEAWHWNPKGTWSDPRGRGYFTGQATPGSEAIRESFGYPLPERGYTHNEGTEADGYSRLTDGDPASYWKSNPYLAPAFTGETDSTFPQWIVIDLGSVQPVDALRIAWSAPFATRYTVERFEGEDALRKPAAGKWLPFPSSAVEHARGGTITTRLAPSPVPTRFVRVLLNDSSNTCHPRAARGKPDRRDCVGYAISEVFLGTLEKDGAFHDLVHHARAQEQTATDCSSVDPWHEPGDEERRGVQTGLDLFYTSGVTRGLPAMLPVSVLYGTPEDSAAQIAYVEKRGYPISYIEMGEEPDGQYMTPEHYAALYLQWAKALHAVDPKLRLGGPVFTGQNEDIQAWPDAHGKTSWLGRFLDYLKAHGRIEDLAFLSFEHYPYEPCKIRWDDLYEEPRLISHILQVWRDDGLPPNVPMLATEVNLAWQSNQPFVDLFGGLWLADYTGAFLSAGGRETYYFHYLPGPLWQAECDRTWGAFTMFNASEERGALQPVSQFFAAQILTHDWVEPGDAPHDLFAAKSDVRDQAGRVVVTAYPVRRPDGAWSVLLVNKDKDAPHRVRLAFRGADGKDGAFAGEVSTATFGAAQYTWHPDGAKSHADPDGPILRTRQTAAEGGDFTLAPASITVLRGGVR